jgi:hypothetical protein
VGSTWKPGASTFPQTVEKPHRFCAPDEGSFRTEGKKVEGPEELRFHQYQARLPKEIEEKSNPSNGKKTTECSFLGSLNH